MKPRKFIGIIGSIVLFAGVFAPIVSFPIVGNLDYFHNGKGDGALVVVLATASLVLVLAEEYKGVWITGLGSLTVMAFTVINFLIKTFEVKSQMKTDLASDFSLRLFNMLLQSAQLQWGSVLLVVGVVMVIASASMKEESLQNRQHAKFSRRKKPRADLQRYWPKKKNITIFLTCAILTVLLVVKIYTPAGKREVGYFENEYKGIIPGYTTLEMVYNILGEPLKVRPAGGGRNYFYSKVIINFPGTNNSKVNTVQVTNDFEYETPTGFRLNDSIHEVASSLGVSAKNRSIFDKRYGIAYWHDGVSVTKIVLGHSAYIDLD